MFQSLGKITTNQRIWGAIGSVIVAGTVFKVGDKIAISKY